MEIKELHLRNIASIESADIDFEKGLNDGITGNPASIFLISGDTGVGKSVVLDGISMALYKTTPRIDGVNNSKNNEFIDNDGESIRVASIEQYTRLGISPKDDCYSEVMFKGNDGVEYRAKLTLGYTHGNTDKTTGKRPIKHSKPKWEIKIGAADWTTDSVTETIESAIGLSFEQFCRMAMLAQGQFATFLTGKKEEREAILEQLTNTEHFSGYGQAIKNLFDNAKATVRDIRTEYDATAGFVLKDDQVKEYESQLNEATDKQQQVKTDLDKLNDQLQQIRVINDNLKTLTDAKNRKAEADKIIEGDQYRSSKELVALWDTTTNERQALALLKDALSDSKKADQTESELKSRFIGLSQDLEFRRQELATSSGVVGKVEDLKRQIGELTAQCDELNPDSINTALDDIGAKRVVLKNVADCSQDIKEKRDKADDLKKEIENGDNTIKEKKTVADTAKQALDTAYNEALKARNRLASVESGIKDTLVNLRKNLVTEHIETCPLCGQHIEHILSDEEFCDMVTPFEQECKEADAKRDAAQTAYDAAKSDLEKCKGEQNIRTKQLSSLETEIDKAQKKLDELVGKAGLDSSKPLPDQVAAMTANLDKQENKLKADRQKVTDIQKKITDLNKDKTKLDKELAAYNTAVQTVQTIDGIRKEIIVQLSGWNTKADAASCNSANISQDWNKLNSAVGALISKRESCAKTIKQNKQILDSYYKQSGKKQEDLEQLLSRQSDIAQARHFVTGTDSAAASQKGIIETAGNNIKAAKDKLGITDSDSTPDSAVLEQEKQEKEILNGQLLGQIATCKKTLKDNSDYNKKLADVKTRLDAAVTNYQRWDKLNSYFGGTRFRTLVQTYILRPLLNNANIYLSKITDRYELTCSEDNEQLSILVLDHYNKNQVRSVTVLSGGERFMISLALSLALSSLNRPDMNVNILFIDEGFGTLDQKSLDSVMETLEKLPSIPGQGGRRVGIISHREELAERITVKIQVRKKGQGRSIVEIINK